MVITHKIENISFENDNLIVDLDGSRHVFQLDKISTKLKTASDIERSLFTISPSGYGIHWPLIDEDLSIEGLMKSND